MAHEGKSTPADGLVCVGAVSGARGLRGEVRLKSFTADPAAIGAYGTLLDETATRSYRVTVTGRGKGQLTARFEGVEDRDAAEALKGLRLYVRREVLPEPGEEEYYHADLIGLRAELVGGGELGTVRAVHDFGAGAILEIAGEKALLVPFTRQAVPRVEMNEGRLEIDPPPGLLEPATAKEDEEEKGS